MLKELRLNNLAIIKSLDLEFNEGLVSLTGETGAGKSIILDGISLLIGERNNIDMIRTGEESLFAEGIFQLSINQKIKLNEIGFDIEDDELIISRYFDRNSKSKIMVNGVRITLSKLKEMMSNILDLVGQHDHQYLLNKNFHLELLDKFLTKEGKELKKEIRETVGELRKINKKIDEIEREKARITEKKDIYEFQFDEIAKLKLKENEDEELEAEYKLLFNAGKINDKLRDTANKLSESEYSVLTLLHQIKRNFEMLADISEEYKEILEKLEDIVYELEDISYSVDNFLDDIDVDDSKLEKVVKRLNTINKLKIKYGPTIKEIVDYKKEIEQKLTLINFESGELNKLKEEKKIKTLNYTKNCDKLREMRKEIAKQLEDKIDNELKDLNMENAKFKVDFTVKRVLSNKGMDDVEFLMSTNIGEDYKPLVKVASGGEVSRMMLALKSIFSSVDNISVLIFDEIDTGISGETVRKVAEKLKELSKQVQVICVTHSPQIAGKSKQQFFIKKYIENNVTETKVRELTTEERTREIARIISGDNITDVSIKHAKEIMGII